MEFLWPAGLWYLSSIGGLLLLWRFARPKRVLVIPSLVPYKQLPDTRPRASLPKVNLLFILQLLALLLLALAAAGPTFAVGKAARAGRDWVAIVDTSASMAARERGVPRIDRAREILTKRIRSLGPDERMVIFRTSPVGLATPGFIEDKQALLRAASELAPYDLAGNLQAAIELAAKGFGQSRRAQFLILTDSELEKGDSPLFSNTGDPGKKGTVPIEFHGFGRKLRNVALEGFEVWRPALGDGSPKAVLSVANYSDQDAKVSLSVAAAGRDLHNETVGLKAGERKRVEIDRLGTVPFGDSPHEPVIFQAEARASDDALALDNKLQFVARGTGTLRVGLAGSDPEEARRLLPILSAFPSLDVKPVGSLEALQGAAALDLAILIDQPFSELSVPAIWIRPAFGGSGVATVLGPRIVEWDETHPLARYLAHLDGARPAQAARFDLPEWAEGVVWASDGRSSFPMAATGIYRGQRHILLAFNPADASLQGEDQLDLVVVLINALLELVEEARPRGAIATGDPLKILGLAPGEAVVKDPSGARRRLNHAGGLFQFNETWRAGLYEVRRGDQKVVVAANFLDPKESNLLQPESISAEWLEKALPKLKPQAPQPATKLLAGEKIRSAEKWNLDVLLVLAAFALLVLEWGLYWRHLEKEKTGAVPA